MESIRFDPIVSWILRAAMAALFAAAALHKIRQPRTFLETFSDYEILPDRFTLPGAVSLVMAEVALAVGLLFEPTRIPAGLAGAALLLVYGLAIGVNLSRGRQEIDCGCLGPAKGQSLSVGLVARNAVLAIAAVASSLPISSRSLHPVDAISFVGGVLVLALLFNAINMLATKPSPWPHPERIS